MEKYEIKFEVMETVNLVSACTLAIKSEHGNFVRILRCNGNAIRALETAREKLLIAISENSYKVELSLMELVQLYAACNMAWHHECAEREKQHTECRLEQYSNTIYRLEDAREKILAALNK